jgi:chemotaxis protein histidine kinase CheA
LPSITIDDQEHTLAKCEELTAKADGYEEIARNLEQLIAEKEAEKLESEARATRAENECQVLTQGIAQAKLEAQESISRCISEVRRLQTEGRQMQQASNELTRRMLDERRKTGEAEAKLRSAEEETKQCQTAIEAAEDKAYDDEWFLLDLERRVEELEAESDVAVAVPTRLPTSYCMRRHSAPMMIPVSTRRAPSPTGSPPNQHPTARPASPSNVLFLRTKDIAESELKQVLLTIPSLVALRNKRIFWFLEFRTVEEAAAVLPQLRAHIWSTGTAVVDFDEKDGRRNLSNTGLQVMSPKRP